MKFILFIIICLVSLLFIIPTNVVAENVQVGVWNFKTFEMLYMVSDGVIQEIKPNYSVSGYDITYTAKSDSFVELIIPKNVFLPELFKILDDNDFETQTESFGYSPYDENFLSYVTYVEKGTGVITIGYFKDIAIVQNSDTITSKSQLNFENDPYVRAEKNQKTQKGIELWMEASEKYYSEGNSKEILELLNKAIDSDPQNYEMWHVKMKYLISHQNYSEAMELAQAFEYTFGFDGLKEIKAKILIETGHLKESIKILTEILDDTRDVSKLIDFSKALIEYGYQTEAKKLVYDFHEKHDKIFTNYDIGTIFNNIGLFDDAINYFERVLSVKPNDYDALVAISESYHNNGNYQKSNQYIEKALKISPSDSYLFVLKGDNFFYDGNISDAIVSYLTATKLTPNYDYAYESLGYCYLRLNDFSTAREYFDEAIRIDPNYPDYYYGKSLTYSAQNELVKALKEITNALSFLPFDPTYSLENSKISFALGYYDKSIEAASITLESEPYNAVAYDMIGRSFFEQKNYQKALEYFDISLQLYPDDEEIQKLRNISYEKTSKNSVSNLPTNKDTSKGGGCLIATATFDSELAPQVQKLREIRDSKLLQTESGSQFMESFNQFYYSFSPIIADYERENPVFKEIVKIGITPMITTLSIMDYADTESEVLGIGISLIILNAMMYVGLPVFGIMIAKKRF